MQNPIFYDPERKRWKRLRALFDSIGIVITVVAIVFVISVIRNFNLPSLLLPELRRPYHAIKEKEKASRHQFLKKRARRVDKGSGGYAESAAGLRAAYYVSWDAGSFASLREYHQHLDYLFPEWLHVLSPDGRLQSVTETNQPFDVVTGGQVRAPDPKVMSFLKSENSTVEVVPLVNNFDPVSKLWISKIGDFLNQAESRARFRDQVNALLASNKYGGINIDFEEVPVNAQPGFRALIAELYADLHPRGLKLFVNLPVDDNDFDYAFFASHVDGVLLMNYDQHNTGTLPGPIAGQDWFAKNLQVALSTIPKEKIICAIGNYGYNWTTHRDKLAKKQTVHSESVTVQEAWLAAHDSEEDVELDGAAMNPHIAFMESGNIRHDIWLLDAVTAYNQMHAARQLGIDAFALWRLGSEDRALWNIWGQSGDVVSAAAKLRSVPPGQDVDKEGSGEVLRITQRPLAGERKLEFDSDTGLMTGESFITLPLPYQIAQYGAKDKEVAITFDDGPDPKFTPLILDALKAEDVKAAFFLIGLQAEKYPGLTRRIYSEGHEIGNHTFTHPDISSIGKRYVDIELNLTQRLLASKLGVKPLYFRPPYSIDQEPDTADQVRPLELVQELGYITVGDKIDPGDWQENPRRGADEITAGVLAQLDRGNIILLHDGGGDRGETVRALPLIIHALRERGYKIVPVAELLGKTRAEVMPPISPGERMTARIDGVAFMIFSVVNFSIVMIFFLGDILMSGRLFFVGVLAIYDRARSRLSPASPVAAGYRPSVAVLVPAYNEEKIIARTIQSLLDSDYPNLRIIVIDDGSTDGTLVAARAAFQPEIANKRLLVLTKPNAGKASAANFGLRHVAEEIFVAIDADTVIAPDAISRMVPHFARPSVAAVAGNVKVGNRVNLWTRWQALEYITSQNFERRALNALGAVSVVPGAIGAWRTDAVREAGNYPIHTVAEDADLTMSLLQQGHRVVYEDHALAYTEAPVSASGLMRQRFRWSFGILQAVWKHRAAFLRGGKLGWVALPNILIFQILLPLVSPFIDLMFVLGALNYLVDRHFHPETANPANFERLALFFVLFMVIDFAASTIAFALEPRETRSPLDKWLLGQVWLQRFAYRQLFSVVLFRTLKRALDGKRFAWDKLERTATTLTQPQEN